MSSDTNITPSHRGPIAWMTKNSVAANMFMLVLMLGGVIGIFQAKQEVFPEFSLDTISVQVPYPGASPQETEQGIVLAVEEAVRGIDGVKEVTSVAGEGIATVNVALLLGEDVTEVTADVKNAVDRITSFPEDAEKPIVKTLAPKARVISIIAAADTDMHGLHKIMETARADLLSRGVTQVTIDGIPALEISIEIPEKVLKKYGLTLQQVAAAVRMSSVEIPGGSVKTTGGEVMVRVTDRKKSGEEFKDIILRSSLTGSKIRLGDIATITDGFEETDRASYLNGKPAARITAYRVGDETPKGVAQIVRDYTEELKHKIPDNVELTIWQDDSVLLSGRIELLNKNAMYGGLLVVALLALVLRFRLAFWVSMGIPISFLAAFFLMPAFDASINMITLFAYIVTLGMVVDDAIVVGENIYTKMQKGIPRMQAAIEGAREMAMPVTFSILTTIVAFSPMFFVPGIMGKIFYFIPLIVVMVLVFSLVESFFILPSHLAHHSGDQSEKRSGIFSRIQHGVANGLSNFVLKIYKPFMEHALKYKIIIVTTGVALLIVSVGLVAGGFVPFKFFPQLEGDLVQVSATLPYGVPIEETKKVQKALEEAAMKAIEKNGGKKILVGMFSNVGAGASVQRGPHAGSGGATGSHLLTLELNLISSEQREATANDIRNDWEKFTPELPGLKTLVFKSNLGPSAGAAVDIQLAHQDINVLQKASDDLAQQMKGFSALTDIENSFAEGKQQLNYQLLPKGRSLGLTSSDVARQIRNSFYGAEALREQRGRNEIKVMVRYPKEERESEYNLERMEILTPAQGQVPIRYVASVTRGISPTAINRQDGERISNVKAELAANVSSPREVMETLTKDRLPLLMKKYPGLGWSMAGEQKEQKESMGSLALNFIIALVVMFGVIAIPFKSYLQPLIIMTAIPFGIVGAIFGHLIMGYNLSFISVMGIVALAGVVVNDSIVLIDAINKKRAAGASAMDAVIYGGTRRFRPILLTSLTTFFGLAPMILETSIQARFLIPMAISLGFGVLFGTFVILVLIPALYLILDDIQSTYRRFSQWVNN